MRTVRAWLRRLGELLHKQQRERDLMSVIGIYGVTAYSVARRTRASNSVMWLVLKQSLRQLLVGLTLGLPARPLSAVLLPECYSTLRRRTA